MSHKTALALLTTLLLSVSALAQTPSKPNKVNLIIDREVIRFAPQELALEMRLIVTDQSGVELYDSGPLSVSTLDWAMRNNQGEAVKGGLYRYTLTLTNVAGEVSQRHGYLIVNRAGDGDRVYVATGDKVGIGAGTEAATVTVVGGPEATVGGIELPGGAARRDDKGAHADLPQRSADEDTTKQTARAIAKAVNGTANRVVKFGGDGTTPVDTQVSESNGALVVGNAGAVGNIQIFGPAGQDVFAGMGPDVINGPAFNYGYAGSSFGRSAGFFNVRPDASAVAPNPSLRFLTANQQRMIITNTGRVGIGTSNPSAMLDVAGAINTSTQFTINGNRVLGLGANGNNTIVGVGAGSNTTGSFNSFFGTSAGDSNTTGTFNSFFGHNAGAFNTIGQNNSFFGAYAGFNNREGSDNSFFGKEAGALNGNGYENSFFGARAGFNNDGGWNNSFFGRNAGGSNTFGAYNSSFGNSAGVRNTFGYGNVFIGSGAGMSNTVESYNTFLGFNSTGVADIYYATAIGAFARVRRSNSISLGCVAGVNDCVTSTYVGIGTDYPQDRLEVNGFIRTQLALGGIEELCKNSSNQIALCGSSLRYKEQLLPFSQGLELINKLRPISFNWKEGGQRDIGLAAEEVEKVEPLFVTHNDAGEVEGVKYAQLNVVLINAVKEQQAQIQQILQANQQLRQRLARLERKAKVRRQ